jgi:hypothetical protein
MNNTITQPNGYSIKYLVQNNLSLVLNTALVFTVLLVYLPVFSNQFQLGWDDQVIVINDYTSDGLQLSNLWAILTEFYEGQYAPVNQLSYTLLHALFGYNPFYFHAFGVLIHSINVLLTFGLITQVLKAGDRFDDNQRKIIAFTTALLMALHPFLVESVAWISASKILLYAFFYLLALRYYLRYIASKKISYYLITALMFIISFGAKEQAVTLPICLLLIDVVCRRDLKTKQVWLEKLPLFVLSLFFGYITMLSQSAEGVGALSGKPGYPFYQNIAYASYALTEYWVKCVIPVKLSHTYFFPNAIGDAVPIRFWMYPLLLIIVGVSFTDFWKRKWILFGIVFFLVHLGVVIHLIPMSRLAIIADRYVYIAAIGVFFLIGLCVNHVIQKGRYKHLLLTLGLVYVVSLAAYAHQYSKKWHDSDRLKVEFKSLFDRYQKENYKK